MKKDGGIGYKMNKSMITIMGIVWIIGLFYLGWKTVLWTGIGIGIGTIIKQVKENTRV